MLLRLRISSQSQINLAQAGLGQGSSCLIFWLVRMLFHADRIGVVLLALSLICACGRPPSESSSNSDSQKLPFDRQPRSTGISRSRSVVPAAKKLPEGTPIPIRLQTALSSATSRAGDPFSSPLDEPVVVDGQTLIDRGTPVTGYVLDARPAASSP